MEWIDLDHIHQSSFCIFLNVKYHGIFLVDLMPHVFLVSAIWQAHDVVWLWPDNAKNENRFRDEIVWILPPLDLSAAMGIIFSHIVRNGSILCMVIQPASHCLCQWDICWIDPWHYPFRGRKLMQSSHSTTLWLDDEDIWDSLVKQGILRI